jgi:hypothetical protein
MPPCLRTFCLLVALMAAAQCCTFLLSKLMRSTASLAKRAWRSRGLTLPRFGRRSQPTAEPAPWFPSVANGALVFSKPEDRSGFDAAAFMEQLRGDISELASQTAVPEVMLRRPTGLISYIGSDGVMRTEPGVYDPFGGRVRDPLPGESHSHMGGCDNVIDMRKRRVIE